MAYEEVWISIVNGLVTGVVAGLITGVIVTKYYRKKDQKIEEEAKAFRRKQAAFEIWHDYLIGLIGKITPMGDMDIKRTYSMWDIGMEDEELMRELVIAANDLERQCIKNNRYSNEPSKEEQEAIDKAFGVISKLNEWVAK